MTTHYIDNPAFLQALLDYKQLVSDAKEQQQPTPRIPEYIGECFLKIANRLAFRYNFINYTFRDEMVSDGIENCLKYVCNFDPARSVNPFAYFTQIVFYAFVRRIQIEKKQLHTKYKIIESLDLDSIITQEHDEGTFDSQYIDYLKAQLDGKSYEATPAKQQRIKTGKKGAGKLMFD